jgi:hypothetical protein
VISGLEGRQLLSMMGSPKAIVGSPKAIVGSPKVSHAHVATAPPVTTFGDTSNAAPALVEFHGKTLLVWSSSFDGALNVATIAKGPSGYQLESKVRLGVALSPDLTPAATVFNGRLYLAWTAADGHLNVICSTDGVHFTNQVTLGDTSKVGPTMAAFNGRLYLGWVGTNGHLNVESSANGMSFSNKVTLGEMSDAAPALTVEQPAGTGQSTRLVLGWTGVGNAELNGMTSTDGQHFGGKATSTQKGFDGLAVLSPSAGTIDIAWTGLQTGLRHLNFMQV